MPDKQYSAELCLYIGRVELEASQSENSFARYMCFCDALRYLSDERLSKEDSELAEKVLSARAEETTPSNIGCASGEAGEAD